jgi:hypothetical protein
MRCSGSDPPRVGVAGLNPTRGVGGALWRRGILQIAPAIRRGRRGHRRGWSAAYGFAFARARAVVRHHGGELTNDRDIPDQDRGFLMDRRTGAGKPYTALTSRWASRSSAPPWSSRDRLRPGGSRHSVGIGDCRGDPVRCHCGRRPREGSDPSLHIGIPAVRTPAGLRTLLADDDGDMDTGVRLPYGDARVFCVWDPTGSAASRRRPRSVRKREPESGRRAAAERGTAPSATFAPPAADRYKKIDSTMRGRFIGNRTLLDTAGTPGVAVLSALPAGADRPGRRALSGWPYAISETDIGQDPWHRSPHRPSRSPVGAGCRGLVRVGDGLAEGWQRFRVFRRRRRHDPGSPKISRMPPPDRASCAVPPDWRRYGDAVPPKSRGAGPGLLPAPLCLSTVLRPPDPGADRTCCPTSRTCGDSPSEKTSSRGRDPVGNSRFRMRSTIGKALRRLEHPAEHRPSPKGDILAAEGDRRPSVCTQADLRSRRSRRFAGGAGTCGPPGRGYRVHAASGVRGGRA